MRKVELRTRLAPRNLGVEAIELVHWQLKCEADGIPPAVTPIDSDAVRGREAVRFIQHVLAHDVATIDPSAIAREVGACVPAWRQEVDKAFLQVLNACLRHEAREHAPQARGEQHMTHEVFR